MPETPNRSTQQPQSSSKQHCQVHEGVSMLRIVKLPQQRKVSAGDAASMPPRDAAGLAEWTQLNGPAARRDATCSAEVARRWCRSHLGVASTSGLANGRFICRRSTWNSCKIERQDAVNGRAYLEVISNRESSGLAVWPVHLPPQHMQQLQANRNLMVDGICGDAQQQEVVPLAGLTFDSIASAAGICRTFELACLMFHM